MPKRSTDASPTRKARVTQPVGPQEGHAVTLAESVTGRLRAALLEGHFSAGEKLHEESLSDTLKVSRTPVRAALLRLAAEGLLDYVPNRGFSVRTLDAHRLRSIFEVRGVLEGLAARTAAEQGLSASQQAEYAAALAEGDRVFAKGRLLPSDRAVFSRVNARIHEVIIQASNNRMLQEMLAMCHNIPASSERNVLWDDYGWLRRSHDDHHRIFQALMLRDGHRAEQLMREHVYTVKIKQLVNAVHPASPAGA